MTMQEVKGAILWFVLGLCVSQGALRQKNIHGTAQGQHFGKEIDFVEDHGISELSLLRHSSFWYTFEKMHVYPILLSIA